MASNNKINLTETQKQARDAFIETAKKQLNETKDIMPETADVMKHCPGTNPIGYTSEIDMEFDERMKRCENASHLRDPLAWEIYQDIKGKIEASDGYKTMKAEMKRISGAIRVIDRALRLCKDETISGALKERREALKQSPVIQDCNMYLRVMECYSGAGFLSEDSKEKEKESYAITKFCRDKFNVKASGTLAFDPLRRAQVFSNPKKLEVEFENFHDIVTFHSMMDDMNLGVPMEEVKKNADPKVNEDYKKWIGSMPQYMMASCDRMLNAALPNVKDRADLLFIDGVSVRDRMKKEQALQGKEITEEDIKKYSGLYVAAALRKGSYVETFTRSIGESDKINYKPVPITVKGENSYIMKKSGANEVENITVGFLDRFLAKIGINKYKEKVKVAETADKIKESRKAFREAHKSQMKAPLTKEAAEMKKNAFDAVHKYKDRFLKMYERDMNFGITQRILDKQFFPEGKKDVVNKETGYVVDSEREKVRMMAITQMLKDGFTLEQILDTSQYAEDRAKAAQKVTQQLENCDKKTFYEMHMEVTDVLGAAMEKYAKDHNISFKNLDSIMGDPHAYLLDLCTGAGNITDFFINEEYKKEAEELFGNGIVEKMTKKTDGYLAVTMLPQSAGKVTSTFNKLADGGYPMADAFNSAVKREVVSAILAKFEDKGQMFTPPMGMQEVDATHKLVMAHPNIDKYFKNASPEQLIDMITKGNILKDLHVDFEILPKKMVPGADFEHDEFGVMVFADDPSMATNVVPTYDGSSAIYEMHDPEMVMENEKTEMQMDDGGFEK